MKKLIVCLAIATLAVSCKKIQAGGNKNILKLEEGAERYSDDPQGSEHGDAHAKVAVEENHGTEKSHDSLATSEKKEANLKTDSTKTKEKH